MAVDYDFRLGRNQLRGKGWRGLAALVIVLALRAALVATIAVSANTSGAWLARLVAHPG